MKHLTALNTLLAVTIVGFVMVAVKARKSMEVKFYLQQQMGVNEGITVNGTETSNGTGIGFGMEAVYEYPMTATDPSNTSGASAPPIIGFVRGTAVVVNNTPGSTTFVVRNVVHYGENGSTWVQEGEADFTNGKPWEFAIVGGTGKFRKSYGYSIGTTVSFTQNASASSNLGPVIVTAYDAYLWFH